MISYLANPHRFLNPSGMLAPVFYMLSAMMVGAMVLSTVLQARAAHTADEADKARRRI